MIDVKFQKDVTSEYMIVPRQISANQSDYEEQILHNNNLAGLLPFKIKEENGDIYYYYDIRYSRSLAEIGSYETMAYQETKILVHNICQCMENLEDYLLCGDNIWLDERYVYKNMKTDQYMFVYVPGHKKEVREQVRDLLAWLMKHINYSDKACVTYVFEFYRKLENGEDIFDMDISGEEQGQKSETFDFSAEEKECLNEIKEVQEEKSPFSSHWKIKKTVICRSEEKQQKDIGKIENARTKTQKNFYVKTSGVGIVIIIGTVIFGENLSYWVRAWTGFYLYRWVWPVFVFAIGVVFHVVCGIYKYAKKTGDNEFWNEEGQLDFNKMKANETTLLEKNKEYLQTQLLGQSRFLLVGKSENCTEIIEITQLPFTIGKNREVVQYAIGNSAVSRRHVQISADGGRYYVTDLYSTNGTKINGSSLSPGKAYEIQMGDRLQIADVVFEVQ